MFWIFFSKKNLSRFFSSFPFSLFYISSKPRLVAVVVVIIAENTLAVDVPTRKINCCFYCCCRVSRSCLVEPLFSLLFFSRSLSLSLSLFTTERHRTHTYIKKYTHTRTRTHDPRCWPRATSTTNNLHLEPGTQVEHKSISRTSEQTRRNSIPYLSSW